MIPSEQQVRDYLASINILDIYPYIDVKIITKPLWDDAEYATIPNAMRGVTDKVYKLNDIKKLFDKFEKVDVKSLMRYNSATKTCGLPLFVHVGRHQKHDQYRPTTQALAIGRLMKRGAGTEAQGYEVWSTMLADYEPHTHALLSLMRKGYQLEASKSKNNVPAKTAKLFLIDPDGEKISINKLRDLYKGMILNPEYTALLSGVPAANLSGRPTQLLLRTVTALIVSEHLISAGDNTWEVQTETKLSGLDALRAAVEEVRLPESDRYGAWVITSELAKALVKKLQSDEDPTLLLDTMIRQFQYDGVLEIVSYQMGQPRMGRGLFGENTHRKIQLNF